MCTKPPFIFGSTEDCRDGSSGDALDAPSNLDALSNLTADNSKDVVESSQEYHGYLVGVVFAIGAAVAGSTSNILVSKCEDISSLSMVTYR